MATTTATITLSSSDLLTDNLSLSSTTTLNKNGTTATGLEQMNYHRAIIPTGTNFDLNTPNKSTKLIRKYLIFFDLAIDDKFFGIN